MAFWRRDTSDRLDELNLELDTHHDFPEPHAGLNFDLPSEFIPANINPSTSSSQTSPTQCSSSSTSDRSNSVASRVEEMKLKKNIYYPDLYGQPIDVTELHPSEVFENICALGMGSCGRVSKMRHKQSNTICAVKQMCFTDNREDNKRVCTDLQIILECNCDYIVRCRGYFITDSGIWMCMELMDTCFATLMQKRGGKPLSEKAIGAIAVSVLKALDHLKENLNFMHRDVKPSNILINKQGQIKLCDFGIGRRLEQSFAQTRSGCSCYMAPERIESRGDYDVRADVWSLGITLYELAVGQSPYAHARGHLDMLGMIISDSPPSLPENMNFSDEYRDFIKLCLMKRPEARPKYKSLLEHKFITKHLNTTVTLDELE